MKKLLAMATIAATLATPVIADTSLKLDLGLNTIHLGDEQGAYEDNKLMVATLKKNDYMVSIAKFTNSFANDTWALGVGYRVLDMKYGYLDVNVGVMKGYNKGEISTVFLKEDVALYAAPEVGVYIYQNDNFKVIANTRLLGVAINTGVGVAFKF